MADPTTLLTDARGAVDRLWAADIPYNAELRTISRALDALEQREDDYDDRHAREMLSDAKEALAERGGEEGT